MIGGGGGVQKSFSRTDPKIWLLITNKNVLSFLGELLLVCLVIKEILTPLKIGHQIRTASTNKVSHATPWYWFESPAYFFVALDIYILKMQGSCFYFKFKGVFGKILPDSWWEHAHLEVLGGGRFPGEAGYIILY